MNAARRWLELVGGPFRASWRAGLGWSVVFVFMVVGTVAFWPAFRDSEALQDTLELIPPALLAAFGLEDFASPAGYLKGGLYDVVIPLMFAAAGVMLASSATAGEEDAGRLELWLAQPVTRSAVLAGRVAAVLGWLAVLALVTLASQLASDVAFDLAIADDRIVATIVLCTLLGALYAGVAIAVAGITGRPGPVLALGLGLALVGYLVAALFPQSEALAPWAAISPWDWALAGEPLSRPTEPWRYLVLAAATVALLATGLAAFARRDVRSA
ncbi:MAG: ABC transporter permease [Chloroflexi bacterium]|nr:ABC transporter permease [Chloroflexota bacterium]